MNKSQLLMMEQFFKKSRGALNIDDEGNASQRTVLVENGILKNYLHDEISSKYFKVAPTGSGRRQSFRHNTKNEGYYHGKRFSQSRRDHLLH